MRTELVYGMPESRYHADPCDEPSLNPSIARELLNGSPRRAFRFHPRLGGKTRAPKLEFDRGSLVHELLLGTGRGFEVCDAVYADKHKRAGELVDDWATNAAKLWKEQCRSRGHVPVLDCDIGPTRYAADAIRSRLADDFGIELTGESEVSAFWTEGTTSGGVQCRARLDHLDIANARIIEVKTTGDSAHPDAFRRRVEQLGYDVQAEAQIRAVERIRPELAGRIEFSWVVAELEPPYEVAVYGMDGEMRQYAEMLWLRAVDLWDFCRRSDRWGGYVTGRSLLSPSPWRMREIEDYIPPSSDTEPAPAPPQPTEDFSDECALF